MANALNRRIEPGEIVVVKREEYPKQETPQERAFVCQSGFGMQPTPGTGPDSGRAIFGYWLDGHGQDRILGPWIDPEETAAYQRLCGRFAPNATPATAES